MSNLSQLTFDEEIHVKHVYGDVRCKLGVYSFLRVPVPVSHIFSLPSVPQ